MPRPNVVIVCTDQLRTTTLGCYGNDSIETPAIDGLAAAGIRCMNAYSPHPVCTPARGSIQTGTLAFDHRAIRNWAPIDADPTRSTIARTFRAAGYRTGYIGKWHLDGQTGRGSFVGVGNRDAGYVPPGHRRLGYEEWAGYNDDHDHHRGHPTFDRDGTEHRREPDRWQPAVQADLAADFIDRNRTEPFCLFVSWGPPHPPFRAPEGYGEQFGPSTVSLPPGVPANIEPAVRETIVEYYGMIEALDDDLTIILDALAGASLTEETIVVFTADHGEQLGQHGSMGKSRPYDPSANVPLLVRFPGTIDPGQTTDALISLADLYPTLADLTGVDRPTNVSGRSHATHVRGDAPASTDPVYLANGWRAIRTERYKLVVEDGLAPAALYDLEADPHEQTNRVESADPALLAELLWTLAAEARRVGDHELAGDFFRLRSPWGPDLGEPLRDAIEAFATQDRN